LPGRRMPKLIKNWNTRNNFEPSRLDRPTRRLQQTGPTHEREPEGQHKTNARP
jgi:hypothetical protein